MKKRIPALLLALALTALAGCSSLTEPIGGSLSGATDAAADATFTASDLDPSYNDATATHVTFSGDSIEISGAGASADGSVLTISDGGTCVVSGTLDDGQIIVNISKDAKLQLVFDGVSVTSSDGPALWIKQADKVFLTLNEGTENTLTDSETYTLPDGEDEPNACLYTKEDFTINGSGALTVNANYNHGIHGKDDIVITGGIITVNAVNDAIKGKDCVKISDGVFTLTAGGNGIQSNNSSDTALGYVAITSGSFIIDSEGDGINAETSVNVSGGELTIATGDDGIHATTDLVISGGTITVTDSYEGLEGVSVTISGGTIDVTASDDGINAAGGSDSGGLTGPMGTDRFGTGSSNITITGGTIHVSASGDGLDANGSLTIEGGELYVSGPSDDANGALDYDSSGTISGGTVAAFGGAGMAQGFSSDSAQCSILCAFDSEVAAGTEFTLTDSSGNVLISYTNEKSWRSVALSCPELTLGETYTLTAGGQSVELTLTETATSSGTAGGFGGMGGGGGRPDGEMPSGERPEMPDGEFPQMPDGEIPEMPSGEAPDITSGASVDTESGAAE